VDTLSHNFIMAKRKVMKALKTMSPVEWTNIVGVAAGLIALVLGCANHLSNQKTDTDKKIAAMERRTDEIVEMMTEMRAELKQTSNLLNADLSWRYLYRNDPTRKRLVPRYHPDTRTLEFVDTTTRRGVRNP
jgi:hypothetical protein